MFSCAAICILIQTGIIKIVEQFSSFFGGGGRRRCYAPFGSAKAITITCDFYLYVGLYSLRPRFDFKITQHI